jgi:cytochrome d ubiquinol oxidase subunit II
LGSSYTITLFPLLCGMAMVSGCALLGSAWLVYKASGTTQTFGREVSRAACLLTMALFTLACFWKPFSVAHVARRWFTLPGASLIMAIAAGLIVASVAFWRSIWSSRSDALLLRLAITMTVLAFVGFVGTIWPYAVPYQISIADGAGDLASIKFALAGITVILPVVLTYQLYAYRVFRGKTLDTEISYGTSASVGPGIHAAAPMRKRRLCTFPD